MTVAKPDPEVDRPRLHDMGHGCLMKSGAKSKMMKIDSRLETYFPFYRGDADLIPRPYFQPMDKQKVDGAYVRNHKSRAFR